MKVDLWKIPIILWGLPGKISTGVLRFDYDKCIDCGDCAKFCAHEVYASENDKIIVQNPLNCVVFCQACAKMCPIDKVITFPAKKDVLNQIKQIKSRTTE